MWCSHLKFGSVCRQLFNLQKPDPVSPSALRQHAITWRNYNAVLLRKINKLQRYTNVRWQRMQLRLQSPQRLTDWRCFMHRPSLYLQCDLWRFIWSVQLGPVNLLQNTDCLYLCCLAAHRASGSGSEPSDESSSLLRNTDSKQPHQDGTATSCLHYQDDQVTTAPGKSHTWGLWECPALRAEWAEQTSWFKHLVTHSWETAHSWLVIMSEIMISVYIGWCPFIIPLQGPVKLRKRNKEII